MHRDRRLSEQNRTLEEQNIQIQEANRLKSDLLARMSHGQERVELSGFGGFLVRGEPTGITLGNSIRWGVGAGFPTGGMLTLFTELHGEVPLEDNVILTTALVGTDGTLSPLISEISAPVDLSSTLGIWKATRVSAPDILSQPHICISGAKYEHRMAQHWPES